MKNYLHRLLGLYTTRAAAETVRDQLVECGLPAKKVKILEPGHGGAGMTTQADSDDVLQEMLREGMIGTVIGTLAAAAGTIAMAAAKIGLFASSPLLGALIMLGWGATIGGFVGAAAGARSSKGAAPDLVNLSLASGHVVIVAHTSTEAQTRLARQILGKSMCERGGV